MSLLSENVATVLQGQTVTAKTIQSSTIETELLVASEVAANNVVVENNVTVEDAVSAPAFLSLHQFQGFPQNTADISTISSLPSVITQTKCRGGVLAPNGKIYCVPDTIDYVIIIDPKTNTIDTTSITGLPTGEQ